MTTNQDAFTNSNGTDLSAHDANWTYGGSAADLEINTNSMITNYTPSDDKCAIYSDTYDDDQYSEIEWASVGSYSYMGPAIRGDGDDTFYCVSWEQYERYFAKVVSGSWTDLKTAKDGQSNNAGDVVRIQAIGTTISETVNDVQDWSDATDSSITSGDPGFSYGWGSGSRIDNFDGGDFLSDSGLSAGQKIILVN